MKIGTSIFTIILVSLCFFSCENDDDNSPSIYPENLIAYYPFNGNANDVINANNGFINGPLLTEDNDAYIFDGIDDSIEIEHTDILNLEGDFTISVRIKANEIKSQTIIRKGSEVNGESKSPFTLTLSQTNDIVFSVASENGATTSEARKTGYDINTWYLITGVYKNSSIYLYVNGILEDTEQVDGLINTNNSTLLIGTRLNIPSSTFNGVIDDVRIYNTTLSETEINELLDN